MQIIDLTHLVEHDMPVYPGEVPLRLRQIVFIKDHGYNNHLLETGMHVGTHMDAPLHMIDGGRRISELQASRFVGKGVLIHALNKSEADLLEIVDEKVSKDDIVVFNFDYSKNFKSPDYYYKYPEIPVSVAQKLADTGIKLLCMDTPSPDRQPFAVHQIILSQNIPIVENLCNLDKLTGFTDFSIVAMPLRIHADGSPARVVALITPEDDALSYL